MNLLIKNLRWLQDTTIVEGDLRIAKGRISQTGTRLSPRPNERVVNLPDRFAYPALVNAHDHLEMNLYPRLGRPPYGNYVEWARDIYHPGASPLREIESCPINLRLLWGGIKNMLSGVGTVIHHNPWRRFLGSKNYPVRVPRINWIHSLHLDDRLHGSSPRSSGRPLVIHAAEGIDALAHSEIERLHQSGLLSNNTVLIHAIALKESDVELLASSGASVVWCPSSNLYLFERTADVSRLKSIARITLGTDSTLTGSSSLLEEMRVAHSTGFASAKEIYEMVTSNPASVFALERPEIVEGASAEFFVAPVHHDDYFTNLVNLEPQDIDLFVSKGSPSTWGDKLASQLGPGASQVFVSGEKILTRLDITRLKERIEKRTGKDVLVSPLWRDIQVPLSSLTQ